MAVTFTNTAATNMLSSLNTDANGGAGAALLVFYSGSAPATAEAALSGNTVLAKVVLADPAFTVSGKTATMAGGTRSDTAADATGTVTFWRLHQSSDGSTVGTAVAQGTVTATGGGGDIEINTTSVTVGGPLQITSWTISLP